MGLSESQFQELLRNQQRAGEPPEATPPPTVKSHAPSKTKMNRWETGYAESLEMQRIAGEILWWGFEKYRFRLAAGSFYTPDFVIVNTDNTLAVHEVKSPFAREASIVRWKVAAEQYPHHQFLMIRKATKAEGNAGWIITRDSWKR